MKSDSFSFQKTSWGLGAALLLILGVGCSREQTTAPPAPPVSAAASAPAAAAPAAQVAPPAAEGEMFVDEPPPPQEEVMVARPGPDYVYVRGYWGANARKREWVRGHWERPPHPRAEWVPPRWEHRGRGYVFVRGYWR